MLLRFLNTPNATSLFALGHQASVKILLRCKAEVMAPLTQMTQTKWKQRFVSCISPAVGLEFDGLKDLEVGC